MKILDDILTTLRRGGVVMDIRQGPFQTAVLTHSCGLAATPHEHSDHQDRTPVAGAGNLIGKEALDIARMAYSSSHFEAAIGMAAINSLLDVSEECCVELNASSLLAEKGSGKRVVLVGHFPFVERLRQSVGELRVIELNPREGDLTESEGRKLIPRADVVGITGTAFTNHTVEHLLSLCRPEAYVVILGGTAPLSPVLFDYGVDAISGTRVIDPEAVFRGVSQGATFRQLKGIRLLTLQK